MLNNCFKNAVKPIVILTAVLIIPALNTSCALRMFEPDPEPTILKQKKLRTDALAPILDSRLTPAFYEILPRDHAQIVDEIVKLMSLPVPQVSMETAQKMLGRGPGEVARILKMINDAALADPRKKEGDETPDGGESEDHKNRERG